MTSLALHALTFAHGSAFELGPVTAEFSAGSRTAIVGPSGAGKSTLLRCIAGLETPRSGFVLQDGSEVNSPEQQTPPHLRGLGFLFQDGALWPHMTALQHLRFAAPGLSKAQALAWLERVGLGDKGKRRPAHLSGGEGRRLALARALCGGARTLLLDEPLHSLDVHLRDGLALLIRELTKEQGVTTILVTHDREEALAMADDLIVLGQGVVVEQGTATDLLAQPKTAWTAAFLARAAVWPVTVEGNKAQTPFGEVAIVSPETGSAASGPLALATLPGDVVRAEQPHSGPLQGASPDAPLPTNTPMGVVLHGEPHPGGWTLAVALQGRTLRVTSDAPVPAGTEIPLRLHTPRLLPHGSETGGEVTKP